MTLDVKMKKRWKGFSLDVELHSNGTPMGILGASGCGKSMTLQGIAGILTPDEGRIVLNGRVLFDSEQKINLPSRLRKVGYLFQNYALFPNMTVQENISIVMVGTREEKKKRIASWMDNFKLEGLENRYPFELSGGQQQRVALARMLASEPDIILLDEPFSALDTFLREQLQRELVKTLEDFQGNVVMVSHSRDEIYRLCDETMIMDQGRNIISGNTKQIFQSPRGIEAARLTGCKNIAPIEKIGEKRMYVEEWGIELTIGSPISHAIRAIGIRAHYLEVTDNQSLENTLEGIIEEVMETPFEIEYLVRNTKKKAKSAIWFKHEKETMIRHKKGEVLRIFFPPDKILLLE